MPKLTPSPGKMVIIAGFTLSCFGLLLFLWIAFGGSVPLSPKGYRVQASFPDAASLADQADVRIAGVTVGKVVKRTRAGNDRNRTVATLEIDEQYVPVPKSTRAMLRQKTLLGETYVELAYGKNTDDKLTDGGRLADGQIAEAVEFDELLSTFDADTRRNFQRWQAGTADATRGRARDLSDALGNLPRFAGSAQTLVEILNRRRDALKAVIRDTGTTFDALNRDAGALRQLIVRSDDVLSTVAARREALATSVRIFPTFLEESRLTLRRVDRFGRDTEPLLRDLEPVLEDAQPTLRSLARVAPDLQDLFEDLPALIRAGRTGLPALSRVLRGLDPTLASVGPFLQQLNPVLEFLEAYQATVANFITIGAAATAGIRSTNSNTTNGHVLPQQIVLGSQSLPAPNRSEDNRGNAYLGPGDLLFDAKAARALVPPSFDCRHVGEKDPGDTPGCFESAPVDFGGESRKYPHVNPARRGGLTVRPDLGR